MRFCGSDGYVLSAPFHVVLDNFNEGTHTPFVHGVTGPTPDQWDAVSFDWSDQPDHVAIHYQGPQRNHLVFHGQELTWDIAWRTYFAPVHMVYESAWFPPGRPEAPRLRLRHAYFIAPLGAERTRFHAFTFAAFDAYPRALHGLLGLFARRLTRNQILEDERFYPLIRDLPRSFHGLHLERYDQPLFRIRTRADAEYFAT
jgi:vanillate O-demethylase monooxygenase subunit